MQRYKYRRTMMVALRWFRLFASFILFTSFVLAGVYRNTIIYLLYQARGQFTVLLNTQSFEDYEMENKPAGKELENLRLIEKIKQFSTDSLAYKSTSNFTKVFNQKKSSALWVITACRPYAFEPYEWNFPIVGKVSYKGFFKKELAEKEYNHLICEGYDVDLRSVSAWSTLGWFSDPVLSGMLSRSRGGLCNLLFHELFHATFYAPNSVDLNENLASFVAHKATLMFLRNDTTELRKYLHSCEDDSRFDNFMLRQTKYLDGYYKTIQNKNNRQVLKFKALYLVTDSLDKLALHNKQRYASRKSDILSARNAYFIDFRQYESLQDSLEQVFNKIYKGDLKKLVQDLKQNGIYY